MRWKSWLAVFGVPDFFFGVFLAGAAGFWLLGRAIDDLQPAVGKRVNSRPRSAEKSQHRPALAFVAGADRDVGRNARPLHRLAFRHAEPDTACNLRHRRFKLLKIWISTSRSTRRRCCSGEVPGNRPDFAVGIRGAAAWVGGGAAACAVAAVGGAHRPSAATRPSGPTGPCGPRLIFAVVGRAQAGVLKTSADLKSPPSF